MKTPFRCPVCGGNGLVSNGFYTSVSGVWSTSSITPETCRSCNGTGIVWAIDIVYQTPKETIEAFTQ